MKKYIFLFEISNNQDQYARCALFIHDISHNQATANSHNSLQIKYLEVNAKQSLCRKWLQGDGFQKWTYNKLPSIDSTNSVFIFRVKCSNEDDVVNLLYFCLLKDQYPESILCVDSENLGKAAGTIPYFLYDQIEKYMPRNSDGSIAYLSRKKASLSDYSRFSYFINTTDLGIIPMILPKQKIVKKFSTLIEINQDKNTARVWGESVGNCLTRLYKKCRWGWDKNTNTDYIFKNYWPNIVPKALHDDKDTCYNPRQDFFAREHWEYRLFVIFTECLCTILSRGKIALTRRRYQLIQSEEFFKLIKDMPLLALYIFCLFDVASKDVDELNMTDEEILEQFQEQIFNARDMVDGLLQIIENVYHSEHQKGYFYFRIHTSVNRNNKYLEQNYHDFLKTKILDENRIARHFLEVKVADYSHQTIPYMFLQNYQKRMTAADKRDQAKYQNLHAEAQKITLRSFFAPTETESQFWEKYNDIAENVVHHYGLQAFDSFVINNQGYFYVQSNDSFCLNCQNNFYDSMGESKATKQYTLPGSQYETLLPFQVELEPTNTLLNVNINYIDNLLTDYVLIESISFTSEKCINIFDRQPANLTYQQKKEKTIHNLYQELQQTVGNSSNNDNTIIWCSAKKIALSMTEIFCKVMMLYIVNRGTQQNSYFMITDCTESHFVEITRMIALFYNKQGTSSVMKNVQIYLSGPDNEEFILAGNSLGAIATKAEKLAFARGITPKCVRLLNTMLKHKKSHNADDISIIPFDMLSFGENTETLFERNVRSILNTDIQSENFGCKLDNLHVRIGNKIHITTFYEAELLFHNNYYISRFAYWMAKEIGKLNLDLSKKLTLVGYETYSELLLQQVQDLLPRICQTPLPNIQYIIYEQKTLEKFRTPKLEPLCEYANSQFVLIVPINSTTTTHSKLVGFLQKEISNSYEQVYGTKLDLNISPIANYGVILIGSKTNAGKRLQKQYWINTGKNTLYSKILDDKITYFISVKGIWHDPLRCEKCFSALETEYIHEQPLIETNKESIVPMHAIRIKKRFTKSLSSPYKNEEDNDNLDKVQKLSEYLTYSHIVRNGNHFQYYFPTEKYIADPAVEKSVIQWLQECREKYIPSPDQNQIIFDVIVSPLHFSNAAFTNAVNKYVFNDAALVLHFDVEKEFRSNVKTKYSNLLALYRNLCLCNAKSVINCHFIDDTIISGSSFMRARSLIESIFPEETSNVTVNVFVSIIILLNRLSADSKRNYIKDETSFHSYVNLQISSMRNHEDACVLCKKEKECIKLAEYASLNGVYLYWKKKSRHYECLSIETYDKIYKKRSQSKNESKKLADEKKHASMRMICSHKANLVLSKIDNYTEETIEKTIYTQLLMNGSTPASIDELIAYLKVIAKPFICFSKEVKSVIFTIMLKMLNYLLMNNQERCQADIDEEYELVKICLTQVINNDQNVCLLIHILMNRLVELGSNFIIRKQNMTRLLEYGKNIEGFYNLYINRVKQLIFNSTDEIKCLYLEYLLLYGKEYTDDATFPADFCFPEDSTAQDDCLRLIFLENSRAIINGIDYLCQEQNIDQFNIEDTLNSSYYLENYARFLQFQQIIECKNGSYHFVDGEFKKIQGMIKLKKQLNSILNTSDDNKKDSNQNEPEDLYRELMKNILSSTGAVNGELIVPSQASGSYGMPLGLRQKEGKFSENFDDSTLKNLVCQSQDDLKGDTLKVIWNTLNTSTQKGTATVLIKYEDPQKEKVISEIYLILLFHDIENVKLYIALKNLLVFRMNIWRLFNLNSNSLLQNWMSDRFYKEQMTKDRALVHQDETKLLNTLKEINDKYKKHCCEHNVLLDTADEKYENRDNAEYKEILEKLLSLTVDCLIGQYNAQLLGDNFSDSVLDSPSYSLNELGCIVEPFVETALGLWGLNLIDKNGNPLQINQLTGNIAACRVNGKIGYPNIKHLKIMILAAIKGLEDHKQGNIKNITIYIEDRYLYIKNQLTDNLDYVKKRIEKSKKREGNGISVPMIIDICRILYPTDEQIVYVDENEGCFVVRLPIVEREDNL